MAIRAIAENDSTVEDTSKPASRTPRSMLDQVAACSSIVMIGVPFVSRMGCSPEGIRTIDSWAAVRTTRSAAESARPVHRPSMCSPERTRSTTTGERWVWISTSSLLPPSLVRRTTSAPHELSTDSDTPRARIAVDDQATLRRLRPASTVSIAAPPDHRESRRNGEST